VVGDDRQLDAVGPGGALTALANRHPEHVWTLSDNLRQVRPEERTALGELRDGNVAKAVAWYYEAGRIHPVPNRGRAVGAMVKAWANDMAAGHEILMLAYRRDNVEALNQTARRLCETAGLLSGPELTAPGGRFYRAGDASSPSPPDPKAPGSPPRPPRSPPSTPTHSSSPRSLPTGSGCAWGPAT
jgi:hypothetical protein